ncbi:hypothetical protein [Gluconobacter wancherniae]|nr:hypothetical protein [Gluconobacter wancherniae]
MSSAAPLLHLFEAVAPRGILTVGILDAALRHSLPKGLLRSL